MVAVTDAWRSRDVPRGDYRDTPLGDVLPVYLQGEEVKKEDTATAKYRLTREGNLEPWLRLRSNEVDDRNE